MAQYAKNFDEIIVRFCSDLNIAIGRRIERIRDFIGESDNFKGRAQYIVIELAKLEGDFIAFGDELLAWAKANPSRYAPARNGDNTNTRRADHELQKVRTQLSPITSAVDGVDLSTLTLTGAFTFVKEFVGSTIAALVSFGTFVWLTIEPYVDPILETLLGWSWRLIQESDAAKEIVRVAQSFMEDIGTVSQLWQSVANDATAIRTWLEGGAKYANPHTTLGKFARSGERSSHVLTRSKWVCREMEDALMFSGYSLCLLR